MKSSLEHLPEYKKEELKLVADLIVEKLQPDFVLLFGSYARGNWVEDRYMEDGILYEYKSDYDILVVTETRLDLELTNKWRETEKQVATLHTSAPVNLIHHSYGYLKNELAHGSYFFTDIVKDGILLYDNVRNANYPLTIPDTIDPEKVKARAKEEYDLWFESANNFIDGFIFYFQKGNYKEAAFLFHQATERYYTALLLVFIGYKAKMARYRRAGQPGRGNRPEFKKVFPRDTSEKDERFKLLKKAYIDARYKKNYSITKEDLEYLRECVEVLKELVERVCRDSWVVYNINNSGNLIVRKLIIEKYNFIKNNQVSTN